MEKIVLYVREYKVKIYNNNYIENYKTKHSIKYPISDLLWLAFDTVDVSGVCRKHY